jgi:hypothetical protein
VWDEAIAVFTHIEGLAVTHEICGGALINAPVINGMPGMTREDFPHIFGFVLAEYSTGDAVAPDGANYHHCPRFPAWSGGAWGGSLPAVTTSTEDLDFAVWRPELGQIPTNRDFADKEIVQRLGVSSYNTASVFLFSGWLDAGVRVVRNGLVDDLQYRYRNVITIGTTDYMVIRTNRDTTDNLYTYAAWIMPLSDLT